MRPIGFFPKTDPVQIPYGQKMLVLDGERAVPYLEIRTLRVRRYRFRIRSLSKDGIACPFETIC